MTEIEQEMVKRVLIDLFLASPRKRTQFQQPDNGEGTKKKTSANAKRTRKQQPGGSKGHEE